MGHRQATVSGMNNILPGLSCRHLLKMIDRILWSTMTKWVLLRLPIGPMEVILLPVCITCDPGKCAGLSMASVSVVHISLSHFDLSMACIPL